MGRARPVRNAKVSVTLALSLHAQYAFNFTRKRKPRFGTALFKARLSTPVGRGEPASLEDNPAITKRPRKSRPCLPVDDSKSLHRCIYYITCGILPYIKLYIKGSKVLSDEDGEEDIVIEALSLCLTAIYEGI
ncbi:hypothetical protein BGY98DRAFT_936300 [Russula aff. rugulosa BPL654]|nr:hypothetical protein BGY98DRAFT_936300 [Russula aff. rugulosa BPL654]